MLIDIIQYNNMIKNLNVSVIYSGPMWEDGIKGIAEMVKTRLNADDLPGGTAKSVFSVFVEQVTNVLMYSEEKEWLFGAESEPMDVSVGTLALGCKDKVYFIQTGNAVKNESLEIIKNRIDHLNTLDKKGLRQYHRQKLSEENDSAESKGAGLGLIEIARRATSPIEYKFDPLGKGISYFTMYVEIAQEAK